jgi:hypothetical protein
VQKTLCVPPKVICYERTCDDCGAEKIEDIFSSLMSFKDEKVTWHNWVDVE